MNRRKFATRLSIFAAAFVPAAVRGQKPTMTIPGQKQGTGAKEVIGEGQNKDQPGIFGYNFHGSGDGVNGQTDGGNGVHGSADTGRGVFGESSKGVGVWGKGHGKGGIGVYAECETGTGLQAVGGNNMGGAYGQGRTLAGFFEGGVMVIGGLQTKGELTKASGSFKIDHPLAPEKKYLSHSFVESPDMMNVYNDNVTTDANGDATIVLPDYFAALNRDYRYQLTVIGQFAQAIVASKIKDNRFMIKTDKPNVEVSWQVTGIRQDAWANAHRIRVEEEKSEKGLGYLHPELFGQPAEKKV